MGLFGPRRTTVGLDIGSGYVKLAEVGHGGDRPEVHRVAARPMPPGAIVDGEVAEPGIVAGIVRQLVEETRTGNRDVVTALGGHHVFVKRLRLPRMKGAEARQGIRREAERHVPFDIDGVRLDFQILDLHSDDAHMEVLLVAAKRERVDERVTLLADAGVGTVLLDVEALALCNAFTHNYPAASEGLVAVVDCGHDSTTINVLENGVPVLARDHHFGLRGLAESFARDRGLSLSLASEAIRGGQEESGLDGAVDEAAGLVAAAIERTGAFLRSRGSGVGMGRVFLSGGGACMPAMAESLGRRIKVETRVANPFELVNVRTDAPGHTMLSKASPLFLLTLGLALRTA